MERLGHGPATLGELAGAFGLTLNGIKKHVGILEEVDLVATAKIGRTRQCRLGSAELRGVTDWIASHRRRTEARLDSFSAYVEKSTSEQR